VTLSIALTTGMLMLGLNWAIKYREAETNDAGE
jgi:hypothetical protein